MKKTEDPQPQPAGGMAQDIKKALGIDLGDIAKDITKDYLREQVFGRKAPQVQRSKFSRALDAVASFSRSMWWVPAAGYLAIGISVIMVKLLAKLVGV